MASARIAPHSGSGNCPGIPDAFFSLDGDDDGSPSFCKHIIEDKVSSIRLQRGSSTPTQLTGGGTTVPRSTKKSEEDEIGIFAAERYFNGGMDAVVSENTVKPAELSPIPSRKERGRGRGALLRVPRSAGTPSTCSEMSGNSRSSLLRAVPPLSPGKGVARGKLLIDVLRFRCKCACTGKRSIEVDSDNNNSGARSMSPKQSGRSDFRFSEEMGRVNLNRITIGLNGGGGHHFAAGSPYLSRGNSTVARELKGEKTMSSSPPGGFGSPIHERLGAVSGTDIRKTLARISFGRGAGSDDDGCDALSEASSELFEIESFSTSRTSYLKDTSSAISANEPSEASIEWSVVTASAANVSVATDYAGEWADEAALPIPTTSTTSTTSTKAPPRKPHRHQKPSSSGLLLSCASSKAVDISSNTRRLPEKRETCPPSRAARPDGATPAARCSLRASSSPLLDHVVKKPAVTVTEGGGPAWATRSITPVRVPHPRYSHDRSTTSGTGTTLVNRNNYFYIMGSSRLTPQQQQQHV